MGDIKPNIEDVRWNPSAGDQVNPDSTKKTLGWIINEKPPSQYFNWMMNKYYLWNKWFDERLVDPNGDNLKFGLKDPETPLALPEITIDSGKVGINTISPSSHLHIKENTPSTPVALQLEANEANYINFTDDSGGLDQKKGRISWRLGAFNIDQLDDAGASKINVFRIGALSGFRLTGANSSTLQLVDSGFATANEKSFRISSDDGFFKIERMNDDFSTVNNTILSINPTFKSNLLGDLIITASVSDQELKLVSSGVDGHSIKFLNKSNSESNFNIIKEGANSFVVTGKKSPYAFPMNETLQLRVDGGPIQTVTFQATDTTDALVAARILLETTGIETLVTTTSASGFRAVQISNVNQSIGNTLEIVGGTALPILGLSAKTIVGEHKILRYAYDKSNTDFSISNTFFGNYENIGTNNDLLKNDYDFIFSSTNITGTNIFLLDMGNTTNGFNFVNLPISSSIAGNKAESFFLRINNIDCLNIFNDTLRGPILISPRVRAAANKSPAATNTWTKDDYLLYDSSNIITMCCSVTNNGVLKKQRGFKSVTKGLVGENILLFDSSAAVLDDDDYIAIATAFDPTLKVFTTISNKTTSGLTVRIYDNSGNARDAEFSLIIVAPNFI